MKTLLLFFLSLYSLAAAATRNVMVKNDKVVAYEETVEPGEREPASSMLPSLTVFLADGVVVLTPDSGKPKRIEVKRGQVLFRGPRDGVIAPAALAGLHYVRVEFRGAESKERWGRTGLTPNYKVIAENGFVRAYDIRIEAGTSEPQHTHHDRVVVCLSGASLRHVLPDGHQEDSSLATGDCVWRHGQTHVGKNIGKTDLWVIAVEPK